MGKKFHDNKKKFIAASVAAAAVATAVSPAMAEGKSFTDISSKFFAYEEVMGLANAGVISGYGDGTFRPYLTITRGQTAIMLANALKLPAAPNAKQFKDVGKNSPYFNAVSAVAQAGIIKGYGDDFRPQATLTREEMASIMVRAFSLAEKAEVEVPFTDLMSVSPTHRKNVEILYQNGITKGKDGKTYAPQESVTRVQFSMFLYRQMEGSLPKAPEGPVVVPPPESGPIITPPPGDGNPTLPTETIENNIFEGLQVYNKNYIIIPTEEATVFGSENAGTNSVIKGNVTVKGTLKLKNLTIEGTLILDPGDLGDVTLKNVNAAKIEILSGQTGTITFSGVQSSEVIVKDENGIKLETDGTSSIGSLEIAPENGSEVQLAGNFNETNIKVTEQTTLTAKANFIASSLAIDVKKPGSEVKLNADAPVELPAITVNSGVKLTSQTANISAPKINVNVAESNQTVELEGPMGNPEVVVEKPVTLTVDSPVSKVTAKANVSLEGSEAANIKKLETIAPEGQQVTINSADAEVQKALDAKKAESIQLAKTKIEELQGQSNPSLQAIQEADALVKTAISLGAAIEDFQEGEKNLFDILIELKTAAEDKLAAVDTLEAKLLALPKPESLNSYTEVSIARLQKAVHEAKAAAEAVTALGLDPATSANYSRLAATEVRIQELRTSYEQAKTAAIAALQALPEASSIKVANLDAAKKAVSDANTAVATAKLKGVKDTDFTVNNVNLLHKLNELSSKIKEVEAAHLAAQKAALNDAISKVALIPAKDQINVQNLEEVRAKVTAARTAVEAALALGVTEEEITNLSVLVEAEAQIQALDDARNAAIQAANEAIAQLPAAADVTLANIDDAKTKLATAESAVAAAKEKGAIDADFTGLEKLTAVKERITSLEKGKQTAIQDAVSALSQIPNADEITAANFREVKATVDYAKEKVAVAKELGATDSELTGLEKLAAAEAKIAELEAALEAALTTANQKLAEIPAVTDITYDNFEAVSEKVTAAKAAVEAAMQSGAIDSDFTGLNKVEEAEAKIAQLKAEKSAALTAANNALGAVPAAEEITFENYTDAEAKVAAAEAAVAEARTKGAADTDFTGLSRIDEAKAKIAALKQELADAIAAANTALAAVPAADMITIENYKAAEETIAAAEAAVATARTKGAVDADFTGLTKLSEAKAKVAALLKVLADAISAANTALAAVPAADDITIENYTDAEAKVAAAEAAVAEARSKGAADTDFTGLSRIDEAKTKIAALKQELADAIAAANTALAEVPAADTITIENYKAAEEKIVAAEAAVAEARTKGAVDADFTGLTQLSEAKAKVAALLKELTDAIAAANTALADVPAASTITIENYKTAEEKIEAAEAAVEAARAKGAIDTDFTGLARIEEAKTKIAALLKALSDAITFANAAIQALPDPSAITAVNINDAITKVDAAKKAVQAARDKGAVDADYVDLEKIAAVEAKIEEFGDLKEAAITAANEALALIPEAELINETNAAEVRTLVQRAQLLVAEAKAKGAVDTDFTGLDRLAAAEVKLKEFEGEYQLPDWENPLDTLRYVNDNLDTFNIEDFDSVTQYTYVRSQFEQYRQALKDMQASKGSDLSLAEIENIVLNLNMQFEKEGLQKISENPGALTLEDLEKVLPWISYSDYNIDLAAISARLTDMVAERGTVSFEDVESVLEAAWLGDALNDLQQQQENVSDDSIYEIAYQYRVNAHPVLMTAYREKMQQHIAGNGLLTPEIIVQIIQQVNEAATNSAMERIKSDPSAITMADLDILNFYRAEGSLIDHYREALLEKKSQVSGGLTLEMVEQVITEVNRAAYLEDINSGREFYRSLYFILDYRDFDFTLLAEYTEAIKTALASGPLTYEALMNIIKVVNEEKQVKLLEFINNNPQLVMITDLMDLNLGYTFLDSDSIQAYRDALEAAVINKNAPLTEEEIGFIIADVNTQMILAALNTDPYSVSYREITFLLEGSYYEELSGRYLEAISNAVAANQQITKESLNEIVEGVNVLAADEYLARIIENPEKLNLTTLSIAFPNFWLVYDLMDEYRQAIADLKLASPEPLTREDIEQLITEMNHADRLAKQEAVLRLLNENPESLMLSDLYDLSIQFSSELFENYKQKLIEKHNEGVIFTLENIRTLFKTVQDEYILSRINSEPQTLETWELYLITYEVNRDYLEEYKTAIINAGSELTLEQAIALIQQVNNDMAVRKVETAPETLTFNDLQRLYGWEIVKYENYNAYMEEIKLAVAAGTALTLDSLRELIIEVNNRIIEAALKDINDHPMTFAFESLDILLNIYVNEEWLDFYHEAVNEARATGELTVSQLRTIIEQVNMQANELEKQQALEFILLNPDTFTVDDLEAAGFWEAANKYGQYINQFRAAIKEKVQADGTDLSHQEISQVVYQTIEDLKQTEITAALEKLVNDFANVTISDLEKIVPYSVRHEYFNQYLTELELLVADGTITSEEVHSTVWTVNKREALASINAGVQVNRQILSDALTDEDFHWIYDEYFIDYHTAIAAEIGVNGPMTVSNLIEVLTKVNQDKGLEYILGNLYTFQIDDLRMVVGSMTLWNENLEKYRAAIIEVVDANETLTSDKVIEIINTVNDRVLLDEIQQNPYGFRTYILMELLDDPNGEMVKHDAMDQYQQAIAEFVNSLPYGGLLTVHDLRAIVTAVNAEIEKGYLDAVNLNPAGFSIEDLWYFIDDYSLLRYENIDFYRAAVQAMQTDLERHLTSEEIVQAVEQGNADAQEALLDAINHNLTGFDWYDLYNLFNYDQMDLNADLEFYRTAIQAMHDKLGRDLTKEEIAQAVAQGNAAAKQADLDAINHNVAGFDYYDLEKVVNYELVVYGDINFYRAAILRMQEALKRDLTAEEITEAVIQGNLDAIQAALDEINRDGSEFSSYHLNKVLGPIEEIKPDNLQFYRTAVTELRAELGHDLNAEELLQAVQRGNQYAADHYLYMVNNEPYNISSGEFQIFLGDSVKILGFRMQLYMEEIQSQKAVLGQDLTKAQITEAVIAVNQNLLAALAEAVNSSPETLTLEELKDIHLVYDGWWDRKFRMYQIEFINHKANGGSPLSADQIASIMAEVDDRYEDLYAFVLHQETYQVGDQLEVELTRVWGGASVFLVPTSVGSQPTIEELEAQVNSGLGARVEDPDGTGTAYFDTSALQAGEYVAFIVDSNGNMSRASNAITLEGAAEETQDPTTPGATTATMHLTKLSTTAFEINVTDMDQNLDATVLDTIEVIVENAMNDYITVTLTEQSEDSGTFTGGFTFSSVTDDNTNSIEETSLVQVVYADNEGSVFREIYQNEPLN